MHCEIWEYCQSTSKVQAYIPQSLRVMCCGSRPNGVRAAGGQMEVQQVKKKKKRKKSAADEATRLKQKEAALAVLNRGFPSARQSRPAAAQPLLDEPFDPADYSGDDAAFETRQANAPPAGLPHQK